MSKFRSMIGAAIGVLVFATAAAAQSPSTSQSGNPASPPLPEQMPFDIPYGAPIGLEQAKLAVAAAEAEAKRHNWKMVIALVDPSGELVYFEKMDGAQNGSVTVAQRKARTAALYRRASSVFAGAVDSGRLGVISLDPAIVASAGGLPLLQGGKIVGGIGCSSGTGEQDTAVCKAGADMVK